MPAVIGYKAAKAPKGIPPHLVVKLKRGWRYQDSARVFVSSRGQEFAPYGRLPRRGRIVYMVPDLAHADPKSLSKDERDLARYMQVILPKGTAAPDYLAVVRNWPCSEEAQLPTEISLPG